MVIGSRIRERNKKNAENYVGDYWGGGGLYENVKQGIYLECFHEGVLTELCLFMNVHLLNRIST